MYGLREGDIIKIYHFTGARRKKYFMYKVIGKNQQGELVAYDITELIKSGKESAHNCHLKYIHDNCQYEIIYEGVDRDSQELEYSGAK